MTHDLGLVDFNLFRYSTYPLGGSNAEKANNATAEVDDLWPTQVRSRANRRRARRSDARAGAGLHEPQKQDLLGQPSSFTTWQIIYFLTQSDASDHLEIVLSSLDQFSTMTDNLIDFVFNVRPKCLGY
jgi:hypothetical protein